MSTSGGTAGTPATGYAPRPCSPRSAGADRRSQGHRRLLRSADREETAAAADRCRSDCVVADRKGLTTGEISAHFAEVYGASVFRDTVSKITDKVLEEMAEWFNRPLDRVYRVFFIDAIVVK